MALLSNNYALMTKIPPISFKHWSHQYLIIQELRVNNRRMIPYQASSKDNQMSTSNKDHQTQLNWPKPLKTNSITKL